MTTRIAVTLLALGQMLCLHTGCARARTRKPPIATVSGFSLGTAKPVHFSKRPTAQELYNATLALYRSFDSLALSQTSVGHVRGSQRTITGGIDARIKRPDKCLQVFRMGSSTDVTVVVGNNNYTYSIDDNTYRVLGTPDLGDASSDMMDQLGMPRNPGEYTITVALLADTRVGNTPTYLLELKMAPNGTSADRPGPEGRKLYLGKVDLLPRKLERTIYRSFKPSWVPSGYSGVATFVGIHANVNLPNSLFLRNPPAGAKLVK